MPGPFFAAMFNRVESSKEKLSSSCPSITDIKFRSRLAFVVFKTLFGGDRKDTSAFAAVSFSDCGATDPFNALFIGVLIGDMVLVIEVVPCYEVRG